MSNATKLHHLPHYHISQIPPSETPHYAHDIVSMYRDIWLDIYPNEQLGITREDLAERFLDFDKIVTEWTHTILQDENRAYWVVHDKNNALRGFCIAKKGTDENELEYIYILPEAQGKGVGKELMGQALMWMGESKPIVLYGAVYNEKAMRFYEQFGFRLSDEKVPPKVLPNGTELPSMKMVKTKEK